MKNNEIFYLLLSVSWCMIGYLWYPYADLILELIFCWLFFFAGEILGLYCLTRLLPVYFGGKKVHITIAISLFVIPLIIYKVETNNLMFKSEIVRLKKGHSQIEKKLKKSLFQKEKTIKSLQFELNNEKIESLDLNNIFLTYYRERLYQMEKNKFTGKFYIQNLDGTLFMEGEYTQGEKRGKWNYYLNEKIVKTVQYIKKRIGAECRDGSYSNATGRGACSHHGGVKFWKEEYVPEIKVY